MVSQNEIRMKNSTITNFIPEALSPSLLQYNETSINCKDFPLNDKKKESTDKLRQRWLEPSLSKVLETQIFFLQDSFETFFGPNESWKKKLGVSNSLGIDGFDVLKLD